MTERRHRISGDRVLVTVLLSLPLLLSGIAPSAQPVRADDLSDRLTASRTRQDEMRRSIQRQREALAQLDRDEGLAEEALTSSADRLDDINIDQAGLRTEIAKATDALNRVKARRDALVGELRTLDWTLVQLDTEMAQTEADLDARRRQLGDRIAAAYRTGQTSLLEQILDAGSFSDVLANVDAFLRFGQADADLARAIQADQAQLDSLRRLTVAARYNTDRLRIETVAAQQQLADKQERLRTAQERLRRLEEKTRRLQQQQRDEYARIQDEHADTARTLRENQEADAALGTFIDDLIAEQRRQEEARLERQRQRELARQHEQARQEREREAQGERERRENQSPGGNGGPLSWPTSGWVTQEFGCTGFSWEPPRGSCEHFHDGMDIANGSGTPVRAAAVGTVVFVGYNPFDPPGDRAWVVVITHANGFDTRYAHLQGRYASGVRPGRPVRAGQVIGWMGNTGNSTGTHLHWEVWLNGSPVDPRAHF